jgi:hypothetical protein
VLTKYSKEKLQVQDATLAAGFSLLQSIIEAQHTKGVPFDIHSLSESLLEITSSRYMQGKALRSLLHCLKYIIDIDYPNALSAPTAEALIECLVATTDFLDYPKDVLLDLPSVVLHARIISLCMENDSLSALVSKVLLPNHSQAICTYSLLDSTLDSGNGSGEAVPLPGDFQIHQAVLLALPREIWFVGATSGCCFRHCKQATYTAPRVPARIRYSNDTGS